MMLCFKGKYSVFLAEMYIKIAQLFWTLLHKPLQEIPLLIFPYQSKTQLPPHKVNGTGLGAILLHWSTQK